MYARILAALDGSELAERILPHIEALAEKLGSAVTLLMVTTPVERAVASDAITGTDAFVDVTPLVEEERREAAKYLEHIADRLRCRGLAVQCARPEGTAAEMILEHARRMDTDLIALTTHGRSGLGRVVFGSVADEVLRKAPCPVLLVRAPEERRP
jgi:nucleotide-binding universal stress UspA family protein